MKDQSFYNRTALAVAGLTLTLGLLALAQPTAPVPAASSRVSYLNLTIEFNASTGAPQYVPANFSVPAGRVIVAITDLDAVASWPGCTCNVTGTVGGEEQVNSSPTPELPDSNVAHTFTVPALGINVLSPGGSVVTFTLDLTAPGSYAWLCEAPCGSDAYTGFPMGTPGYMDGTMTVL